MSETKFTKGEWVAYIGTCDTQEIHVEDYAVVGWQGFDGVAICEDEKTANAHLIAAAPEMYEMLDEVLNVLGHELNPTNKSYIKAIKELLAKARGEKC